MSNYHIKKKVTIYSTSICQLLLLLFILTHLKNYVFFTLNFHASSIISNKTKELSMFGLIVRNYSFLMISFHHQMHTYFPC